MHNEDELHGYQALDVLAPVDIVDSVDIVDIVGVMHEKRISQT